MKAKGEQMERAIQSAGGAEPAPHAVPPKYATAEQMDRLIDAIASGGGSGSQEPLVLRGAYDTNPFAGTVTGATKEEVIAAWNAGRPIKFVLFGYSILFTLGIDMYTTSDTTKLVAYFLWQTGGTFFAAGIVNLSTMTYQVIMYQGLTPVSD